MWLLMAKHLLTNAEDSSGLLFSRPQGNPILTYFIALACFCHIGPVLLGEDTCLFLKSEEEASLAVSGIHH